MLLIHKDNKLYLYNEEKDKYILISPEDIEHIFDDNNNLLPDEQIKLYFKFKNDKFSKYNNNKKGYTSKKANIKKEYEDVETMDFNNYLINGFLNDILNLSDYDRLQFIQKPTEETIKQFDISIDERKKLLETYRKYKKLYNQDKKKGDNFKDLLDYIIDKDNNIDIKNIVSETVKTWAENVKSDAEDPNHMDKNEFLTKMLSIQQRLPKKDYIDIITYIKSREFDDSTENQVKLKIDEIVKKINNITINKSDFRDEDYENNRNEINEYLIKGIPSSTDILSLNRIKAFKGKDIKNNAKIFRLLSISEPKDVKKEDKEYKIKFDNFVVKYTPDDNDLYTKEIKDYLDKKLKKEEIDVNGLDESLNKIKFYDIKNYNDDSKSKFEVEGVEDENEINEIVKDLTYGEFKDYLINEYNKYDIDNIIRPKLENKTLDKFEKQITLPNFANYSNKYDLQNKIIEEIDNYNYNYNETTKKYNTEIDKINKQKENLDKTEIKVPKEEKNQEEALKREQDKLNKQKEELDRQEKILTGIYADTLKNFENTFNNNIVKIQENVAKKIIKDKNMKDKKEIRTLKENIDEAINNYIDDLNAKLSFYKVDNSKYFNPSSNVFYEQIDPKTIQENVMKKAKVYKYKNQFVPDYKDIYGYGNNSNGYLPNLRLGNKALRHKQIGKIKFNSCGNWSNDVLERIDKLNSLLKSSSGRFAGNWSNDVLERIDKLNSLLKSLKI